MTTTSNVADWPPIPADLAQRIAWLLDTPAAPDQGTPARARAS